MSLKKSAQRVQDRVLEQGLPLTIKEFPASTRTAKEAATAIGCQQAEIVKTIVFCTKDQKPVIVLASGVNRINEQKISETIGSHVTLMDGKSVKKITGFAIGGVPPIAHDTEITTLIDKDLLQYDVVWAAAGTPNAVFALPAKSLVQITGGTIICVA